MKKWMMVVIMVVLFSLPMNGAFAHSHLSSTDPADGEVKNVPVTSLMLNFDGKIMEGSFVELIHDENGEVTDVTFEIGDGYLKAIPAEALVNGNYTVNWSIISADGHPLEGSYAFTVDAPEVASDDDVDSDEESTEVVTSEGSSVNDDAETTVESNSSLIITMIGIALFIVVGALFIARRKK